MSLSTQVAGRLIAGATEAMRGASEYLLARQDGAGYWQGGMATPAAFEPDYILLQLWLHPPGQGSWNPPTRTLVDKAVRAILEEQFPDGGFSAHPGGPADLSATVKAYSALKLAGLPADGPELSAARRRILALGGIQEASPYVKAHLSLFGLYPQEHCPPIPPEIILLPGSLVYRMPALSRAIAIPLSVVQALGRKRPVPDGFNLDELSLPGSNMASKAGSALSWRNASSWADRLAKVWERYGSRRLRQRAIRKAERWILERVQHSSGLAPVYPPVLYAIMALDVLGYAPDHAARVEAQRQFDRLMADGSETSVRDTAVAAYTLAVAGFAPDGALRIAADWLLANEVRRKGDWSVKRPKTEPSGWCCEFASEFYPDAGGTAMVLLALRHIRATDSEAQSASVRRAIQWLLDMQSSDGGWAAFDVDNGRTAPDITGGVLEALCAFGLSSGHPAIRRGVQYLLRTQEQDGSWDGRGEGGCVYGTFRALRGLRAAGENDREAPILRAGEWLRSVQNSDGGWGENPSSTPSVTAWALLGLIAGGDSQSRSVHDGVEYLLASQRPDGSWDEKGRHPYRHSFPLLALGTYLKSNGEEA